MPHRSPHRRDHRTAGLLASVVGAAVLFAACGGSSTGGTETSIDAGAVVLPGRDEIGPSVEHATTLIADLDGDEDAAFDAVAYGLNNGYDSTQIAAAINSATLGRDGRVVDVEPNRTPPDLLEPQGQGFYTRTADEAPRAPIPIQELRNAAHREAGQQDGYELGV